MTSDNSQGWEQAKSPYHLSGVMATDVPWQTLGTTCAMTKTSKSQTQVTLLYNHYSVVLSN